MAMRRFRIAQDSMRPNLSPGDEVVAVDGRRPVLGDIVTFPHPTRSDFWLIKRVAEPPQPLREDQVWVMSDNAEATRSDSRTLGAMPIETMWTVIDRLDSSSFTEACEMLTGEDEALSRVMERHGRPEFWERDPGFSTLAWLILEQQVSLESGAAMYERLHRLAGSITPETVSSLEIGEMRKIGVTRQKAAYLNGLALAVVEGRLDIDSLDAMPPDEAREHLLNIKGIGPWTADAYLLSALRHPDVFPVGDRALQVGVGETLGMTQTPDPEQLEIVSEPWKPVRAAAARIIWHGYLADRGRDEPTDPTLTHRAGRDA
jgi:DNA-3-methyladenine glycosylase II